VRWIEAASATERAVAAARCALMLRERAPGVPISLATVRGGNARDEVIAAAIDRAAELVRDAGHTAEGVRLDETTAGLLDARFEVKATPQGLELMSEREVSDDARRLLGVAAPCVGRERELALLDATLAQTQEDGTARALVITADAGVGKTRLRQEWVRRIKARDEPISVWMGRGDPLGTRSPYGLLAQALRRAMGIRDDEALSVRQARVRERVRTAMLEAKETDPVEIERVVLFVSELVGAPYEESSDTPALFAARRDRMLMGDHLRRAFCDFIAAEAKARPVVLVLEDPHWGDAATLRLIDAALGSADDLPLFVVAFARPILKAQVPHLWAERRVQEVKLEELSRKASERLAKAVLPANVPQETIDRMVTLAHGNAFFLEELVRAVAEGKGDHLPDTVLAVVESRLESFEPEARRLLRAASVFGQFFWAAGVVAILGDVDAGAVAAWLDVLVEREVITARRMGRFANEVEYAFRHAVVRDAAYATLVADDRKVAHHMAATWLLSMGERDAGVLASHFELGGDVAKAAEEYARAAVQMIQANDFDLAVDLARRGLARGASTPFACDLWLAIIEAERWRGDNDARVKAALQVMKLASTDSDAYAKALEAAALSEVKQGDHDAARAHLREALKIATADLSSASVKTLAASAGVAALFIGDKAYASSIVKLLVDRRAIEGADPATRATVHTFWAFFAETEGDIEAQVEHFDHAADSHAMVGNVRSELMMRANAAFARGLVGHLQDAESKLRTCLAATEKLGLPGVAATARTDLASVLEWMGRYPEARELGLRALADHQAQGDKRMEAATRVALALVNLRMGEVDAALVHSKHACELVPETTGLGAFALAAFAYVNVKTQQFDIAMEAATRAYDACTQSSMVAGPESFIRLVYARALQGVGRLAEARMAVASAHARLLERVARMRSAESKEAFLTRHWENAQLLEWAKASGIGL
jgi:eukaryotic-like serine/threonine-protein kinase